MDLENNRVYHNDSVSKKLFAVAENGRRKPNEEKLVFLLRKVKSEGDDMSLLKNIAVLVSDYDEKDFSFSLQNSLRKVLAKQKSHELQVFWDFLCKTNKISDLEPNHYSVFLRGFMQGKNISCAHKVAREMEKRGKNERKSLLQLLTFYTLIKATDKSSRIISTLISFDDLKPFELNAIIDSLGHCELPEEAERICFEKFPKAMSPNNYNSLIEGYCRKKKFDQAIRMIEKMRISVGGTEPKAYATFFSFCVDSPANQKFRNKVREMMAQDGFLEEEIEDYFKTVVMSDWRAIRQAAKKYRKKIECNSPPD